MEANKTIEEKIIKRRAIWDKYLAERKKVLQARSVYDRLKRENDRTKKNFEKLDREIMELQLKESNRSERSKRSKRSTEEKIFDKVLDTLKALPKEERDKILKSFEQ